MGITSALVLFSIVWFMTLLIVLPLRLKTQGDEGEIVPGTHASAPANFSAKRTAWVTTLFAVPVWVVLSVIILSGVITIKDLDWFGRMESTVARPSDK